MIRAHPNHRSIQPASATSGARAVWAGHMGARRTRHSACGLQRVSNRALLKLKICNGAHKGNFIMNKSLGLAALCALISPSVALAQDSANADIRVSLVKAPPVATITSEQGLNFGTIEIPRSNGGLFAQCKIELSRTLAGNESLVVTTMDTESTLRSDCAVTSGTPSSLARFGIACPADVTVLMEFEYISTLPDVAGIFPYSGSDGRGVSVLDEAGSLKITGNSTEGLNIACNKFSTGEGTIVFGGTLFLLIKEVEDRIFGDRENVIANNFNIGTLTASISY